MHSDIILTLILTLFTLQNAVLDLQRHPDIQVLQSASTEETLAILESINADLDQR